MTDLLAAMSLEEKVGQMTQVTLHPLCIPPYGPTDAARLDPDRIREAIVERGVGSIFNVAGRPLDRGEWRRLLEEIQDIAVRESRLGIPVLFGLDAVHGSGYTHDATIFPHNLGLAATWRPELSREASRITALELAECGVPWNFSPVLDVGRNPLWSRVVETFGEDTHLARLMGVAAVLGHQDVPGIAACAKHFVGYSAPATGRDRTTANIPETLLRDVYLPPFAAAVAAGVETVMVNSGDINGVPLHASRWLLTEILRGEMGFEGVIVTDWEDVIKLHTLHRVAATHRDAVRMAVDAGIDMSMTPFEYGFADDLVALVRDGDVAEERIDESVRRILSLKHRLGLLERPLPKAPPMAPKERIRVSGEAAAASLVLLENDGILPLKNASADLVGPGADSLPALCGPWTRTWQGDDPSTYPDTWASLRDAWEARRAGSVSSNGASAGSEIVILALSESPTVEKPGDIVDLRLDPEQQRLGERLVESGARVVLLLLGDRPRVLDAWVDRCAAVLWCGRPGPHGAEAIVDLLLGLAEPEGRLPITYPRHTGELLPYDHRHTDRVGKDYGINIGFRKDGFVPRWEFGDGLSYTQFEYADLQVEMAPQGATIRLTVANTGERSSRETVQVYLSDEYASIAPPVKRLAAFSSVMIEPGETSELCLKIPIEKFGFHGPEGFTVEPGDFTIRVGPLESSVHLSTNVKTFSQALTR